MEQPIPFTIVVADDDQDDRDLFRELFLGNQHFTLIGCLTSGIEVFDEISRKKNVPDILLIDMYMPFFTGVDVVKALEKLHAAPNMVKFIISTTENIPEKDEHLDNPYVVFLRKPITTEEIRNLPNIILAIMMQRENLRVKSS
jgi:CheY-like chemotaxis protein